MKDNYASTTRPAFALMTARILPEKVGTDNSQEELYNNSPSSERNEKFLNIAFDQLML